MLDVHHTAIKRWRDQGVLKEGVHWTRIGHKFYFSQEELAKLLPGYGSVKLVE